MASAETRNIKTLLTLYEEVQQADHMILHSLRVVCSDLFEKIIKPKMWIKEDQETVILSVDEFNKIRRVFACISFEANALNQLDNMIDYYMKEKEKNEKIIQMLKLDND